MKKLIAMVGLMAALSVPAGAQVQVIPAPIVGLDNLDAEVFDWIQNAVGDSLGTLASADSIKFGTKTITSYPDSIKGTDGLYRWVYLVRNGGNGFGYEALMSNTGSLSNGFGTYALRSNTGLHSNGFGYYALQSNTGSYSNGFGYESLRYNTGSHSNGFGEWALQHNTGSYSNGFGHSALRSNTRSSSNGFGYEALMSNTGSHSSGFGNGVLMHNTGSSSNGFGNGALMHNTGSSSNGIGNYALQYNTGLHSSGFGHYALQYNTGSSNTAIGSESFNTFNENAAGAKTFDYTNVNPAGSDTLTITGHGFGSAGEYVNLKYTQGTSAITGISNGDIDQYKIVDANTLVGRSTAITAAGTGTGHTLTPQYVYTNSTAIGYNAEPTASNQIMLGDANVDFVVTAGAIVAADSVIAAGFRSTSDGRLKTNIESITGGLDAIMALTPRTYTLHEPQWIIDQQNADAKRQVVADSLAQIEAEWAEHDTTDSLLDGAVKAIYREPLPTAEELVPEILQPLYGSAIPLAEDGTPGVGLVAQEVRAALPPDLADRIVPPVNELTDTYGIAYDGFIPLLIRAVQEQQAQIDSLKARVDKLEGL